MTYHLYVSLRVKKIHMVSLCSLSNVLCVSCVCMCARAWVCLFGRQAMSRESLPAKCCFCLSFLYIRPPWQRHIPNIDLLPCVVHLCMLILLLLLPFLLYYTPPTLSQNKIVILTKNVWNLNDKWQIARRACLPNLSPPELGSWKTQPLCWQTKTRLWLASIANPPPPIFVPSSQSCTELVS